MNLQSFTGSRSVQRANSLIRLYSYCVTQALFSTKLHAHEPLCFRWMTPPVTAAQTSDVLPPSYGADLACSTPSETLRNVGRELPFRMDLTTTPVDGGRTQRLTCEALSVFSGPLCLLWVRLSTGHVSGYTGDGGGRDRAVSRARPSRCSSLHGRVPHRLRSSCVGSPYTRGVA